MRFGVSLASDCPLSVLQDIFDIARYVGVATTTIASMMNVARARRRRAIYQCNSSNVLSSIHTSLTTFVAHGPRQVAEDNRMEDISMQMFARFVRDESGATAIEYGLIAALIAVVIIGAVTAVGTKLSTTFTTVSSNLK